MLPPSGPPKPEQDSFVLTGAAMRHGVETGTPEQIVNSKPAAQAAHERAESKAAADHERRKDMIRFCVGMAFMTVAGLVALYLAWLSRSPEEARWAGTVVMTIVGAAINNVGKK